MEYRSPFPYFGVKYQVASEVWERFGKVQSYREPFFGTGAILFCSPYQPLHEVINDASGFVSNFWRAIKANPEGVARWCTWPSIEVDLHARHAWLVNQSRKGEFVRKLFEDPDYFNLKLAGWWAWGLSNWIGGDFCKIKDRPPRRKVNFNKTGVLRYNRKKIHAGSNAGISRFKEIKDGVMVLDADELSKYFSTLQSRLMNAKILCGDWKRAVKHPLLTKYKPQAIFLDPPYAAHLRQDDMYAEDAPDVAKDVVKWAKENGENENIRIAVCGLLGEHTFPESWKVFRWKNTQAGYSVIAADKQSRGKKNRGLEAIWFSPHCLHAKQKALFENEY